MMSRSLRFLPGKHTRGFSLIEVLITLAIIALLTALVMVRYGTFNSAVLLKNQAFELALGLREAQVFSVSVRSDSSEFRQEYGMYLTSVSPDNQEYIFWQDDSANGDVVPAFYNETPSNEQIGNPIGFDNRFEIIEIYVNCTAVDYTTCSDTTDTLSVSFARPNFDAVLVSDSGEPNSAHIVVADRDNNSLTRAVVVTTTGSIAVQ